MLYPVNINDVLLQVTINSRNSMKWWGVTDGSGFRASKYNKTTSSKHQITKCHASKARASSLICNLYKYQNYKTTKLKMLQNVKTSTTPPPILSWMDHLVLYPFLATVLSPILT